MIREFDIYLKDLTAEARARMRNTPGFADFEEEVNDILPIAQIAFEDAEPEE